MTTEKKVKGKTPGEILKDKTLFDSIIYRYDHVIDAMMEFGKQCYLAGEMAGRAYHVHPDSSHTRKELGYVFWEEYVKTLKGE